MKNQTGNTTLLFGTLLLISLILISPQFLQAQSETAKEADFFALDNLELSGITDFTANKTNKTLKLQWKAKTKNTLYFIQRSNDNQHFKTIKVIEKKDEKMTPVKMYFEMTENDAKTFYYYRILKINKDGSYFYTKGIKAAYISLPLTYLHRKFDQVL